MRAQGGGGFAAAGGGGGGQTRDPRYYTTVVHSAFLGEGGAGQNGMALQGSGSGVRARVCTTL